MAASGGQAQGIDGVIVSADSHVMEPVDLWKKGVPEKYREAAPVFPPHKLGEGFQKQAGGWDPNARIKEMEIDGLSAEVLYPTLAPEPLRASPTPGCRRPASASTTTG